MKNYFFLIALIFSATSLGQKVDVRGKVTDQNNGAFIIEIVVNEALAKVITDPKQGRTKYIRLYQNPNFVVRTDSTGLFKIRARETDTLYFKSYGHKVQKHRVSDLIARPEIEITLDRD
ncbi:MAG: hypothetical protein IR153_04030 [Flavobacterium sp.]|nr:hypothetical protein [Flavobacterium sp.]